uniref:Uncharacterized protein n=1 Tax=Anopheles albimanus TaxID=7167 RepID=A0A182F7L1_ANOAL
MTDHDADTVCPNSTSSNTQLQSVAAAASSASAKKNSSRRNAWGNLSYADLITQAISSASDSRLTLSQIYEWMVQNVPYFKDKGDSNSSAGWKHGTTFPTGFTLISLRCGGTESEKWSSPLSVDPIQYIIIIIILAVCFRLFSYVQYHSPALAMADVIS